MALYQHGWVGSPTTTLSALPNIQSWVVNPTLHPCPKIVVQDYCIQATIIQYADMCSKKSILQPCRITLTKGTSWSEQSSNCSLTLPTLNGGSQGEH